MKVDLTFYEEWVVWTGNKARQLVQQTGTEAIRLFARDVAGVTHAVAKAAKNPLALFSDPLKPARAAIRAMKEKWGE